MGDAVTMASFGTSCQDDTNPVRIVSVSADQVEVLLEGEKIQSAQVDVYCGETLKENLVLQKKGTLFTSGAVTLCKERMTEFRTSYLALDGLLVTRGRFIQSFPNPRSNFVERPALSPLIVNAGLPHYFSRRSREQGERDLQQLARTATVEEGFVFVEGRDWKGVKRSYWYEVGWDEKPASIQHTNSNFFVSDTQAEFVEVTGWSHYHFHPSKREEGTVGREYPSPADFNFQNDAKFGYPRSIFDHRIVTEEGIFRMKPNLGRIEVNQEILAKKEVDYREFFYAYIKVVDVAFSDLNQAERNARFAAAMSSSLVEVSFTPFGITAKSTKPDGGTH